MPGIASSTDRNPFTNYTADVTRDIHATLRNSFIRAYGVEEDLLVQRLQNLLQTFDPAHRVQVKPGNAWTYDHTKHTLTYPNLAVLTRDLPYNLGVVCRELGRHGYSFAPARPTTREPGCLALWSALDSLRTSNVMCARFAGARALLEEVYRQDGGASPPPKLFSQYLYACLASWSGETARVQACDARVLDALAVTKRLVDRVIDVPPGVDLNRHEVTDAQKTQWAQRAEVVVRESLWPILRRLAEEDHDWQVPPDAAVGLSQLLGEQQDGANTPMPSLNGTSNNPSNHPSNTPSGATPPAPQAGRGASQPSQNKTDAAAPPPPLDPNAMQALEKIAQQAQQDRLQNPGSTTADGETHVRDPGVLPPPPLPPDDGLHVYERIVQKYRREVDMLAGELESIFRKERLPRYTGYFKTGRYDLKKAVAEKFRERATGTRDPKVFLRRDEPTARSVAFIVCADVTGSMCGAPIGFMRDGAAVLVEAAQQAGVKVGLLSYTDKPTVMKNPDDSLETHDANRVFASMDAGGRNNERLALDCTATMAADTDATEIYVLFITDGGGTDETPDYIAQLEKDDPRVKVLGIGIGPGCSEVPTLYKRHRMVPRVQDLPQQLGNLLIELQRGDLT